LPILLCVAWFAAHGALDDLVEVHLKWTVLMYSGIAQPWLTRVQDMIGWLLTSKFAVALGLSVAGLVFLARTRGADALIMGVWLGLALFNVVLQGKYWQYHWLVIYPLAAVLTGMALVAVVIAAFAAVEARVFDRRRALPRAVVSYRPAANELDHAAFARALTAVAAAYLTACEREEQP